MTTLIHEYPINSGGIIFHPGNEVSHVFPTCDKEILERYVTEHENIFEPEVFDQLVTEMSVPGMYWLIFVDFLLLMGEADVDSIQSCIREAVCTPPKS